MRALATTPAARALMDDAAVLPRPESALVLTHDMLVEGIHFLPDDPAETVAWKLCAVNMSDLNAKGATPLGILVGYGMTGNRGWDAAFARGLGEALRHFNTPLLGGDTVRMPVGGPRTLGLTAIGAAPSTVPPARSGAQAGDLVFVTGTIGDAGAGLAVLQKRLEAAMHISTPLVDAYRQPRPPVALGPLLAPFVTAMADVSDGLLIDTDRIARASGVEILLDLAEIPLSAAFRALCGDAREAHLSAATAGDDYQLLFTAPAAQESLLHTMSAQAGVPLRRIGICAKSSVGIRLHWRGEDMPLPDRLGFEHGE